MYVKVADTTLRDHWFHLPGQRAGEEGAEIHFEARCGADELAVEEDLVGFAEVEGELVCVHEFAVLFCSFEAHFGGIVEVCGLMLVVAVFRLFEDIEFAVGDLSCGLCSARIDPWFLRRGFDALRGR